MTLKKLELSSFCTCGVFHISTHEVEARRPEQVISANHDHFNELRRLGWSVVMDKAGPASYHSQFGPTAEFSARTICPVCSEFAHDAENQPSGLWGEVIKA